MILSVPGLDFDRRPRCLRHRQRAGGEDVPSSCTRPLDAIDFTARDGFAQTGWPIAKEDLDPYLAPAKEIRELEGDFTDAPLEDGIRQIRFLNSDPPVRFGDKYGDAFEDSDTLSLHANLVGLDTVSPI